MPIVNVTLYLFALHTFILVVHGTHFEGGTINYKVVGNNGSGLIVRISQSYTYTYPTIYCNDTYIADQWALSFTGYPDAGASLACIGNCSTNGGYSPVPMLSKCTDYSAAMSITVGQQTDDVILANGSYFTVGYTSNVWRNLSLPSGVSTNNWSISIVIDLRVRADRTWNTPPMATMISPLYIPVGVQQKISIPTIDADNDNVRCRFASGTNECGTVCPPASLPAGSSISTDCNLTITGTTIDDWYSVALEVEDFGNSTSTTPYSSVPVQFLVYVYGHPACTQRPYLYGDAPAGSCVGVEVGVPFTLLLIVENYCAGCSITMQDIATQSFPIVIKSTIVQNTTILWSVTLQWTPTTDDVGSQILCSVGIDSQNVQSNQYCLTFTVGDGTLGICPGSILTTQQLTTDQPTTITTSFTTVTIQLANTTTQLPNTTIQLADTATQLINTTTLLPNTTTQLPNTTIQVDNSSATTANNSSSNLIAIILPIIIIISICCSCCWFYFVWPWRTVGTEQEQKKPITTYTIQRTAVHRDFLMIGDDQSTVKNEDNSRPTTCPSNVSIGDGDGQMKSSSHRSPVMFRRNSFPLLPSLHVNASTVPNVAGTNLYQDNARRRPDDSLSYLSTSQLPILASHHDLLDTSQTGSASNNDSHIKVRQLHPRWVPRWVVRLSQLRNRNTAKISDNVTSGMKRPQKYLSTTRRFLTIKPRYAYYNQ